MVSRRTFLKRSGQLGMALLTSTVVAGQAEPSFTIAHAQECPCPTPRMKVQLIPMHPSQSVPTGIPLEVKIGQMVMVGFAGTAVDAQTLQTLQQKQVGGIVFFGRNVVAPAQLKQLTTALQSAMSIPLLIATDQEGGRVSRLPAEFGLASNYSSSYLGVQNNVELTHTQAASIAHVLAQVGINLNLAPVVDLAINPNNGVIVGNERSFSADPAVVITHARAMIEAHHQHKILCTLKHFPGHGSSLGDTHAGFVDVTDTWQEVELTPFAELSKQTLADVIMTAHVFNARLDPDRPATLSRKVVTGILREQLGYQGVIMTDDMQMGAIAGQYAAKDAVLWAIEAGVDILTHKNIYGANTVNLIQELVAEGKISPARIDQSYQRIRALKSKLLVTPL